MTDAPCDGGARLMIGFDGPSPTDDLRRVLNETGARCVVLFARNHVDAGQTADLITAVRELVPWPLVFAVDQEGGEVVRLTQGVTVFPSQSELGASGDVEQARRQGELCGRELAALGIDLNLAPVVDLLTNPDNSVLAGRSLGDDPGRAAPLARALIEGHARSGVTSCLKHFPGLGAAAIDPHEDLPVLDDELESFRHPHVTMFERLLDAACPIAIMTTHILVRGLDFHPATFSRRIVTDLLRRDLGFDGVILSDDLEMGAVTHHADPAPAAVRAAAAGHDIVLMCHTATRQLEAARRLTHALQSGDLDPVEHATALSRIDTLVRRQSFSS